MAEKERHITWWSGPTDGMPEYLCPPCWDALLWVVRAWMKTDDTHDPAAVYARQQALVEVSEAVAALLTEMPRELLALPSGAEAT